MLCISASEFMLDHLRKAVKCKPRILKRRPPIFLFTVFFITYFKLDTSCTYSCIGTSGKKCQIPHERVLLKTTAEGNLNAFH